LYGPGQKIAQGVLAMSDAVKTGFAPFSAALSGTVIVFTDETMKLGQRTAKALESAADSIKRAASAAKFKGKSRTTLEILAPAGLKADCLLVIGTGEAGKLKDDDYINLGGVAAGKAKAGAVTLIAELPGGAMKPRHAAAIASGLKLRAYR